MEKIYKIYCRIEEIIVGVGFSSIVALTFINAVMRRAFNAPIVYADDICLLLFSWTALLGADVSLRYSRLVGMDLIQKKFPPKVQKVLQMMVYAVIIALMVILISGGIKIIQLNSFRYFNTLEKFGIKYSAVNAALPVCGTLIIISCLIKIFKLIRNFKNDEYILKKDVPQDAIEMGEENAGFGEEAVVINDDVKEVQP